MLVRFLTFGAIGGAMLLAGCSNGVGVGTSSSSLSTAPVDGPSAPAASPVVPPVVAPTDGLPLIGVFSWDRGDRTTSYEEWLGRDVRLGQSHQNKDGWANVEAPLWQLRPWSAWVNAVPGRILNYSVVILPNIDGVSLSQCAAGAYDAHYTTLAQNLVKYKLANSILRLGWEFDGGWMKWSSRGQESTFAACFRRVVDDMRAVPGQSFKFDWNPNSDVAPAVMAATWPGDSYVDYVGVDIYDALWSANTYPFPADCDSVCRSTRQQKAWATTQGPYLAKFVKFSKAHQKPLSVPEWGLLQGYASVPGGQDNPTYIINMLNFIFDPSNNVGYASYFDVDTSESNLQISDVSTTGAQGTHSFVTRAPKSAAVFRQLVQSLVPVGR